MKRAQIMALVALAATLSALNLPAQEHEQEPPVVGPPNGSLLIAGGAMRDPAIRERFFELAGGADAPIVIIPTASGRKDYSEDNAGLAEWKSAGATNLTSLHTTDRSVANTDKFVAPIRDARAVWFSGGRQWRLADAYLKTKVHDELWALLERGGVIGGSSAGATIQGEYLARGDSNGNTIMMGDHEQGLSFLKNTAIDQHLLRRNRQFDLIEIIRAKPELLGIGIDENTAIIVAGDSFEVIGQGYVGIYDAGSWLEGGPGGSGGPFYFLAPGDRYDLKTRVAIRPAMNDRLDHLSQRRFFDR